MSFFTPSLWTAAPTTNVAPTAVQTAKNILRDLIGFNTTTSPNPDFAQDTTQATEYVGHYLRDHAGAEIHFSEPYPYPPGSGKMHKSLIAVWRPKAPTDKKPLAFSGHIDVVPAPEPWQGNDPFTAREENGKTIGRGALDLKGQNASLMAAFDNMYKSGKFENLDRPIVFMLSSCEEVGSSGAADVCELAKKHDLVPGEVVVIEPTDGYVGLGSKGSWQEDLSFAKKIPTPKGTEEWPHYCTVTVQSKGGHSSLQGAGPADPALVSVDVLDLVKELRKNNVPAEICDVDYGVASNVVGGKSTITIGYAPPKNSRNIHNFFAVPEFLRHQLEDIQQRNANRILSIVTVLANKVNSYKNEITGMDFGKVSIQSKLVPLESQAKPAHPVTVMQTENGLQSDSAIEHALETVRKIYALHDGQDQGGQPKDYAIPLLGTTKLSVPQLRGNSDAASLSYDMRYPMEAGQENNAGIESTVSIANKIHEAAKANPAIAMHLKESIDVKPYIVSPEDKRLSPYVEITKNTGFAKYRSRMTNLPYTSDGNIISKEFPDALVVTMASGGFANQPHGEGEHLTEQQIRRNIQLFEGIINEQALPNGKQPPSRQRQALG